MEYYVCHACAGQELMKPELERDPIWRSIPCAKEILVQKGIAERAPWEFIQVCMNIVHMCMNLFVHTTDASN